MAGLIRAKDWSSTACGDVKAWPACLRIAVSTVLDARSAAIVLWGPELVQIYNDAYQALLTERHPNALGQPTRDCWPEVWDFNEPIYRRVMQSDETVHFDDQEFIVSTSGFPKAHYFTLTYSPARDETGFVRGVLVVVVETTDRVLRERQNAQFAEAAKSEARRQAFNLALSDALRCIIAPADILTKASEMLGHQMGVDRVLYCEVDDRTGTFDIRRDWTREGVSSVAGHVRLLADFGDELIGTLRAGKALVISDIATDGRASSVLDSYGTLGVKSFVAIPLLDGGALSVILTVHRAEPHDWSTEELALCTDFTARTWSAAEAAKAQAALRAERDQSQAVFDSMTEGFGLIDQDGIVIRINEAGLRLAQRTAAQVIGHNHWDVWPEAIGTGIDRIYTEVLETGSAAAHEYQQTFSNGVTTWLEVRAYPLAQGGLAIFFRDIGKRKHAEEALLDADRRKDEFLAMLAHELRNPLAPISSAAQLLKAVPDDVKRVVQTSGIIVRQVEHMTSLINDLLDVSRVTSGMVTLDKHPLHVKQIIAESIEQVSPVIEARQHHLVFQEPAVSARVLGDRKRLVQVITNLLHNAAKYTAKGGNLAVGVEASNTEIAISIRDNGVGIDASLLLHVFELFSQAKRTPDRSQGGLGLGLSLVKSLVALHGGRVTASSEGSGKGATFTVYLPVFDTAMDEGSYHDKNASISTKGESLRLLVVDDNVDAANALAMFLETAGHRVTVEHGPLAALEQVKTTTYDVFLLDIGLPGIDGNELARRLRSIPQAARATLIAVTGYGQQYDRDMSRAAGFDYYFVKPANPANLTEILSHIKPT
jgi:PAS domain S-box-containing protein